MSARKLTILAGLCFALGALTDTALTWRLHEFDPGALLDEFPTRAAPRRSSASDPSSVGTIGSAAVASAIGELRHRDLEIPVKGFDRDDLRDSFQDARNGRAHEALDIMANRGTPVVAVESGHIEKLFNSKAGGLTIYQFDPTRMFCYYYAHLDGYARGLAEGNRVERGEVLGYVGSTGNAAENAPHLHFGIFKLTPERRWWKGEAINPYPVIAR